MNVIIRHVRHRLHRQTAYADRKGNLLCFTDCGALVVPRSRLPYEPDRLAHEPARFRCRECFA